MRRIAFASPLPPETSGIADYSAELLPALAAHFEIDLFTGRPEATDRALAERFAVRPYAELAARDEQRPYFGLVYQLGNSAAHHGEIHRLLLARPGVVVLHEYMLHHLMRDLTLALGGKAAFREEMRYCYGATGLRMAGRILHANDLPEMWDFPLFERVVDAARGLLVHSRATRDRVRASRPAAEIAIVPHHLSLHGTAPPDPGARARLLAEHGLAEDTLLLASFGHLTAAKRLDVALGAFARLRRRHPNAAYLLAGEPSAAYAELPGLLAGPLGEGVHATGRLPLPRLLEVMACCDVAVNLRHPTGGETSGACLRLLGLGRPVVVTESGWFAEIPDDCCAKVPLGGDEEDLLAALLEELAASPPLRHALGANAARWAASHHRPADCARGYADFITRIADHAAAPEPAVPPLAPSAPGDLPAKLAAALGAALAELDLDEREPELAGALAATLVDLGLNRGAG
ncbi:MAG: glycosyltransferase family 4 protein [Acidobacteriota bacterium]|nr:glycosyltransferase family 4 protein [Acidobacteriota bacterium]